MRELLIIAAAFLAGFAYARRCLKTTEEAYINVEALLYGLATACAASLLMLLFVGVGWLQDQVKHL